MIQPIGLITFAICLLSLSIGTNFTIICFISSMLLAAASAVNLGGSGNIQPMHVMLAPIAFLIVRQPRFKYDLERGLKFPEPGSWLMMFVIYGVICAMLIPRVLGGSTIIMSIGSTRFGGSSAIPVPLTPTTGNINQSVYMVSDLICFLVMYSYCSSRDNFVYLARAFLLFAGLNIMFAAIDFITSITNTAFLLDPIRNADYDLHLEENVGGLRRIVGSFTETSLFSFHTIGSFAYTFSLLLSGRWVSITLPLSLISLVLLLLSTSGTAYVSLAPVLGGFYIYCASRFLKGRANSQTALFAIASPVILANIVLYILLNKEIGQVISDFVDVAIFAKSQSDSGLTRAEWNRIGLLNFYSSYGIGTGFGTTRVSSWIIAVLASTGVPGTLLITGFIWSTFRKIPGNDLFIDDVRRASMFSCLSYIVAGSTSFSLVDLRLPFFALAALAAARPSHKPEQ